MKSFLVIMAATALGAIGGLFIQANNNVPASPNAPAVAVASPAAEPSNAPVVRSSSSGSTGKWRALEPSGYVPPKSSSTTSNNPYGPNSKTRPASGSC